MNSRVIILSLLKTFVPYFDSFLILEHPQDSFLLDVALFHDRNVLVETVVKLWL